MKTLFSTFISIILTLIFYFPNNNSAQTFTKGEMVGQAGLGFGLAGIYGNSSFPPLTVGLQYGIEDKISAGGLIGFATSSNDYFYGSYSYSYIVIAARGEYHFLENPTNKDLDAYAGLSLGYAIVSSSFSENSFYFNYPFRASASGSYAVFGIHGGVRYYLNPKVAIFGELGYGISYITVGAAYRFQ